MRRDAADNSRIIIARTALRRAPCRVAFLQLSESGTHTEKQGLCGRSAAVWILWSDYYSFLQKKLMRALLSGTERRDITGPPLLPEKQNKRCSSLRSALIHIMSHHPCTLNPPSQALSSLTRPKARRTENVKVILPRFLSHPARIKTSTLTLRERIHPGFYIKYMEVCWGGAQVHSLCGSISF